jgi:hypothetical protein
VPAGTVPPVHRLCRHRSAPTGCGVLAEVSTLVTTIGGVVALSSLSYGFARLHGVPDGVLGVVAPVAYSAIVYYISRRLGLFAAIAPARPFVDMRRHPSPSPRRGSR